jgi:hypothetical protein
VGAFDVLREMRIGAFGTDAAFFAWDDLRGILDPVEDPVMNFLCDIVGGDRSAGVVEVTTAAITSGGGKQGAIGGLDVVAQEAELLEQGNEGMVISTDDATLLNSVYRGRYPSEEGLLPHGEPPVEDARRAVEAARSVFDHTRQSLG